MTFRRRYGEDQNFALYSLSANKLEEYPVILLTEEKRDILPQI